MKQLAIITHLERLPAAYEAGFTYFGLTVAPAAVTPDGDITKDFGFLQPWLWKAGQVSVWLQKDGDRTKAKFFQVDTLPVDTANVTTKPVTDLLLRNRTKFTSNTIAYDPTAQPTVEGNPSNSWHAALAHAALYPAPIPHALGLNWLFKLSNKDLALDTVDGSQIVMCAALSFKAGPFAADVAPADPTVPPPPPPAAPAPPAPVPVVTPPPPPSPINPLGQPGIVSWAYSYAAPGGALPVIACVNSINPLVAEPADANAMIDLSTLWIRSAPTVTAKEWRSSLPSRFADGFDLIPRMIEALRNSPGDFDVADFWAASKAILHDTANAGLAVAPDGSRLADYILGATAISQAAQTGICKNLHDWEAKLDLGTWTVIVASNLPPGQTLLGTDPTGAQDLIQKLQALHAFLADDRSLGQVIWSQWSAALAGNADWAPIQLTVRDQILPQLQLRKRMLLGNIGNDGSLAVWNSMTAASGAYEMDSLSKSFSKTLQQYLADRTGNANSYKQYRPAVIRAFDPKGTLATSLDAFAQAYFANFVASVATTPQAERVPHAITLQVDRTATDIADADDFHRRIAGCGVLMRIEGTGQWRCLTRASVSSMGDGSSEQTVIGDGTVVPYRLDTHNQLRQAFVSYNNHPLIAISPATGLAGALQLTDERTQVPAGLLYRMALKSGTVTDPWATLPGLVYGRSYQLLSFVITNTGALPAELCATSGTAKIPVTMTDPVTFGAAFTNGKVDKKYLNSVTYKRRVPVGPVRFSGLNNDPLNEQTQFAPVPADVYPLARDIEPPQTDATAVANRPLLFLHAATPAASQFQFWVRPPSTDLNTWDRWVGGDPAQKSLRTNIWAAYHRDGQNNLDTNTGPTRTANPMDLTIDDPAVARFVFAMNPVCVNAGQQINGVKKPLGKTGAAGMKLVQSASVPVICKIGAKAGLDQGANGAAVVVTIPPGEVWELSIAPELADKAADLFETSEIASTDPPLRVLIESAATISQLPEATDIWQKLMLYFADPKITVQFDPAVAPKSADTVMPSNWKYVRSVDVLRQTWRWLGRTPVIDFNFAGQILDPAPPAAGQTAWKDSAAMGWEAEAFAERTDDDHSVATATVNFAKPAVSTQFMLLQEDLSNDRRQHYYRFGARVTSRYAGVLTSGSSVVGRVSLDGDHASTIWRRLIVPCRATNVPKPKIKLILPLTAPREDWNDATPGLLCVLNESWFEIGGLGEKLVCNIASTSHLDGSPGILEIGPDPILTRASGAMQLTPSLTVEGPLGLTFDTNTTAPLFDAACFILRPPDTGTDRGWYFARLSFQRKIGKLQSQPTDPVWVQFLPDFTTFAGVGTTELILDKTPDTSSVRLMQNGQPFAPVPAAGQPAAFGLWLVVTQVVTDALGRANQERYIATLRYDPGNAVPVQFDPATQWGGPGISPLRARIVEIQMTPGNSAAGATWNSIFPADGSEPAARVVRMSPPIDMR